MRSLTALLMVVLFGATLVAEEKSPRVRWTKDDLGKVPSGWKAAKTGKGDGSVWKVVVDDSAPSKRGHVLAQTAAGPRRLFNLCVAEDGRYRDVEVRIAFKAVHGKEDQGGGIVWRYQDADNYYISRMNPLESNYRVYKVVAGKRIQLGTKEDLKIPAGEWHVLKIKHVGEHIECWLDGNKHLDVKDKTFAKAGRIGLWTKADAQTRFDDLHVSAVIRADDKPMSVIAVGDKAPNKSSLRDLRGNRRALHDFKDHRALVLVFLGADCPISNLYVPSLLALEKKYRSKNVQFLAVYAHEHEDLDRVAVHSRDCDIPFPVLKDFGQRLA
ncbi:MAG: family 16 glycoside hydrolase, partial [Gemmataceae bacterium]